MAVFARIEPRATLRLTKNIPPAAGLGGGSADAAAALRALSTLWKLKPSDDDLLILGAKLGADVPMCLAGRTVIARGVGEQL
ncbi:GHMP family kinase ATP-binding protein, partial [Staphylococcus aureus]